MAAATAIVTTIMPTIIMPPMLGGVDVPVVGVDR